MQYDLRRAKPLLAAKLNEILVGPHEFHPGNIISDWKLCAITHDKTFAFRVVARELRIISFFYEHRLAIRGQFLNRSDPLHCVSRKIRELCIPRCCCCTYLFFADARAIGCWRLRFRKYGQYQYCDAR
jgi:hypothetical protein